jgi:hypothetical protein
MSLCFKLFYIRKNEIYYSIHPIHDAPMIQYLEYQLAFESKTIDVAMAVYEDRAEQPAESLPFQKAEAGTNRPHEDCIDEGGTFYRYPPPFWSYECAIPHRGHIEV